jgi:hypothetical protein
MAQETTALDQTSSFANIGKLLRALLFAPYGRSLLTPSAAIWMLPMFIVSVSMAVVEGFSWHQIINKFTDDRYPAWGTILFAVTVGLIIWLMDALFITFDLTQFQRKAKSPEKLNTIQRLTRLVSSRVFLTVATRLVFILCSLVITTPFLGEILQREELNKKIATHNDRSVADLKDQIAKRISGEFAIESKKIEDLQARDRERLRREIAGVGESGVPGKGPTALLLQDNLEKYQQELRDLQEKKESKIRSETLFVSQNEKSAEGLKVLQRTYRDIELLTDSPADREKARALYLKKDGLKILSLPAEQVIASALLAILFGAMVIFKLLEPKSVSIYYDAQLQDAYQDYISGYFDDSPVLESARRPSTGTKMGAFAFDKWYYQVYEQQTLTLAERQRLQREKNQKEARKLDLESAIDSLKQTIDQKKSSVADLKTQVTDLEDRISRDEGTNHVHSRTRTALSTKIGQLKIEARGQLIQAVTLEISKIDGDAKDLRVHLFECSTRKERLGARMQEAVQSLGSYLAQKGFTVTDFPHVQGKDPDVDLLYDTKIKLASEMAVTANLFAQHDEALKSLGRRREEHSAELAELRAISASEVFSYNWLSLSAVRDTSQMIEDIGVRIAQLEAEEGITASKLKTLRNRKGEFEQQVLREGASLDQAAAELETFEQELRKLTQRYHS